MIRRATHPLFLFLAVWGVALSLYLGGVVTGLFPAPHALTVGALLLNIGAFSLGYLTWSLLRKLAPQRIGANDYSPLRTDLDSLLSQRMQRALTFTLLMGVIALPLMICRIAQVAADSHTGLFELLTNPALRRDHVIESFVTGAWQTRPTIMLLSLTSGFFVMGFILLGVFLRVDTTARRYVYLAGFLLVGLVTCIVDLSRYDMTTWVLYLVLAYGVTAPPTKDRIGHRPLRHLAAPALGVVLIFVVVELLLHKSATYHQTGGWRTHLFPFYWYMSSSVAAFNDFLGNFQGVHTLGERTFPAFFKWLHRFGLIGPHSLPFLHESIHIPYGVNTYTYLRAFYEDFGLLGVAVVPYVYGGLMAALQAPARRYFPYLNVYILLLVPLLFSWFHYCLQSSQFYLQILFGFLLFRYDLPDFAQIARAGTKGRAAHE
jgi:oligosaccharide repeat unit polymerase